MDHRPNIILLMSDQQKASATSVFGNRVVPTPFWEQMASAGVAFSQAYAPSPVCVPTRAAVATGVYPLVNKTTCNQHKVPVNLKQLSEFLMEAGYYTAVAGHYERKNNLSRGWHEQQPSMAHGPVSQAYRRWIQSGKAGTGWSSGALNCSIEEGHSYHIASCAIQQVDAAREANMPLFMHICFEDPHPPYFVPRPYDTLVDPADVVLPDMNCVNTGRPRWQLRFQEECGTSRATEQDIRKQIAVYYGMIAYADAQMSRIHAALDQRGMLDNTWIILASDHGDYAGEKGLFTKGENLYECLLHVPLVIRPSPKATFPRGTTTDHLVSLVDLFPTVLGIAGIDAPWYVQGNDLVGWVAEGARESLHECVFSQVGDYHGFLKNTLPAGMAESARRHDLVQGVRSREFSYIGDPEYGDEAYDLRKDPKELSNLLADPRHANREELADLRGHLKTFEDECVRLREDIGVIPGPRGFIEGWE